MMLNCKSSLKFYSKFLIIILSIINLVNNKYTFNSENNASTESLMKNYAMNLVDTKFLKISTTKESYSYRKKEKKIDHDLVEDFGTVFSGSENNEESNIISGSILISEKGEMIYSKHYIENSSKGRKLIARARYTKSLAQIGWSRLYVETFDEASAEVQAWAAGFLEGKLTAKQILDFYKNLIGIHNKESEYLDEVFDYYKKVEESIRFKTSKSVLSKLDQGKELEYWISVAMVQAQTDGLHAGYNTIMKQDPLTFAQIYFINADGEVPELLTVFKTKKESRNSSQYSFKEGKTKSFLSDNKVEKFSKEYLLQNFGTSDPELLWNKLMLNSHCSAIIKVLRNDDNSVKDVLVAHTTWDSYAEMHRIFKEYKFTYTMYGNFKKNSLITFSSYPGTLTSTDDFYVLNNKIVVLETTLEMLDRTLYSTKIPQAEEHVPNYIRISVANRLATSGKEWTEIFKLNNGGTYNSQWMILDYSKLNQNLVKESVFSNFPENKTMKEESNGSSVDNLFFRFKETLSQENMSSGFFFILEQIPGYIEIQDMTQHLFSKDFWASYNRPYLEKISRDAGYFEMMRRYGRTYSYEDNPRGLIINKKVNLVKDVEDMKNLMQTNRNLKNDNYINTISPRYDLSTISELKKAAGGIDTKLVSSDMVRDQVVLAISGPSKLGGIPAFSWAQWQDEPHFGLPEVYDFDWIKFDESFIKNK